MSRRRTILLRIAKRAAAATVGALAVWLAGAEALELLGEPWAALAGAAVGAIGYDLRAAIEAA